jgi:hypothetical protein
MRIFQPQFGVGTSDVRRGASRAKNVILQGNSPSITQIFDMKVIHGREFNALDTEHRAPVVLLGFDTANLAISRKAPTKPSVRKSRLMASLFTSSAPWTSAGREFPAVRIPKTTSP